MRDKRKAKRGSPKNVSSLRDLDHSKASVLQTLTVSCGVPLVLHVDGLGYLGVRSPVDRTPRAQTKLWLYQSSKPG
jgi:hypothetical protein